MQLETKGSLDKNDVIRENSVTQFFGISPSYVYLPASRSGA
jgi:hypothetical protein